MRISDWSSDVCSSDLLPSLKLKQAPPSPPALIQQHLIAGEPQFQSCAQMDKPSRVGYGLHRRNTQPAKSARYWSASTCFTRWTFISTDRKSTRLNSSH